MRVLEHKSREEWFQQREGRVTASKIARLYGAGPLAWEEMRAEDRGEKPTFQGNAFTQWGSAREDDIAEYARSFWNGRLHHNDNLILSDDDERFAATPDMLGVADSGEVLIGEIKTVGTNQAWSYDATTITQIPRRYQVQVMWQMMVTGATRCLFVWERRGGTPGHFVVDGAPQALWCEPDEGLVEEIREVAYRYLGGELPTPSNELVGQLAGDLVRAQDAEQCAHREVARIKTELEAVLGAEDARWADERVSVSWTLPKPRRTLDQKALKKAHPEIVDAFMVDKPATKRVLRVTRRKDK